MSPTGLGGSVGTNGKFATQSPVTIAGSLWVLGADGVTANALSVGGELHSAGPLSGVGPITVSRDAFVAGKVGVSGTLTAPAVATLGAMPLTTASTVRAPVSVAQRRRVRAPPERVGPGAREARHRHPARRAELRPGRSGPALQELPRLRCGASGVCGACTDSSQCCSPLSCQRGQCVYILG